MVVASLIKFFAIIIAAPVVAQKGYASIQRQEPNCNERLAEVGARQGEFDPETTYTAVSKAPVSIIYLPYKMSPIMKTQLARLPVRIQQFPELKIYLAYFARPETVVPRDKFEGRPHEFANIELQFKGYYYLISFPSAQSKQNFIEKGFKLAFLDKGFLEDPDSNEQAPISLLTPSQFLNLTQQVSIEDAERKFVGFKRSSKHEVELKASHYLYTTSGTAYYFDEMSKLVGMRKNKTYYRYESQAEKIKEAIASHAAILARAKRTNIVRLFKKDDIGLIAAKEESNRILEELQKYLRLNDGDASLELGQIEDGLASALARMGETNKSLLNLLSDPSGTTQFYFLKLLKVRIQALHELSKQLTVTAEGNGEEDGTLKELSDLASDPLIDFTKSANVSGKELAEIPPELRKGISRVFRFVWLKGLPISSGFIVSRDNLLLHEQLLNLALGNSIYEKFVANDDGPNPLREIVRGGLVRVGYDDYGRPSDFTVINGAMRLSKAGDSKSNEVYLSELERDALQSLLWQDYLSPPRSSADIESFKLRKTRKTSMIDGR